MSTENLEEYKNLQNAVAEVEKLIAGSPHKKTPVLSDFLVNAKKRLDFLEREIKAEEQKAVSEKTAAVNAAQQEAALNQQEKETFSGFLQKEFFTKKDFGALEAFYSGAWDKLSEKGKEAMSHRIWEGIRKGEYHFTELPEIVREKEAKFLYDRLVKQETLSADLSEIPEADRNDFIKAYENGNAKEAYKILDRESFRDHVAIESPKAVEHTAVDLTKNFDAPAIAGRTGEIPGSASKKTLEDNSSMAKLDLSSIDLKNLNIADEGQAAPKLARSETPVIRR